MCVCVFLFPAVSSAPRTFSGKKLVLNKYVLSDCEGKAKIKQMFHVKKYFVKKWYELTLHGFYLPTIYLFVCVHVHTRMCTYMLSVPHVFVCQYAAQVIIMWLFLSVR